MPIREYYRCPNCDIKGEYHHRNDRYAFMNMVYLEDVYYCWRCEKYYDNGRYYFTSSEDSFPSYPKDIKFRIAFVELDKTMKEINDLLDKAKELSKLCIECEDNEQD